MVTMAILHMARRGSNPLSLKNILTLLLRLPFFERFAHGYVRLLTMSLIARY